MITEFNNMKNNFSNKNITLNQAKIGLTGKYIGDLRNDMREGKEIYYYNSGNRYEGDCNKKEGKRIYYFNSGNKYMKEIGEILEEKEKEYIIIIMVIDMKEIGEILKKKEKEYINIIMVIDIKENGEIIKKREKEYFIVIMVLDTKGIGEMIREKEKE